MEQPQRPQPLSDTASSLSPGDDTLPSIETLAHSLRSSSPIRSLALELLDGKPPSTIQPLLDALANPDPSRWKECTLAAWMLGHIPLPAEQRSLMVERLCQVLDEPRRKRGRPLAQRARERVVRALPLSGALGLGITLAFLIFALIPQRPSPPEMEQGIRLFVAFLLGVFVYTVVCSPLTMPLTAVYDRDRLNRVRAAAAAALGRIAAPESIGALARAAWDRNPSVRHAAQVSLLQTLPNLTPDHYGKLDPGTVSRLCFTLRKTWQPPLALAILEALEKIGDGSAVETVALMAENGVTEEIREVAALLLPILNQRRDEENAPKMLLRASDSTALQSGVLLRPATGSATTEVEQLLRASTQE